ncbi:cysteine proteinase [Gloeophyllum trabeum ATCC 11539]|uniref:ubiquitinyl hydrolase 1 n=1 Tax=Gloeophyllum trabeum (strain ATCC 11539 / FP-39264 / Madison 617) TaxID=670483 RepID=S7Q0C0_GLOTA|nr:cysteine proteinase [Gloeophyllum trabeum ATCC 11539]EPQ53143.1 cysteine proteinase [Gloeophyllum trabeum ATCC 11539]
MAATLEPGSSGSNSQAYDLVGGPFAVIESDPGVFSTLIRQLGVRGLELVEIYDIEPWAVDHLKPYGLIFCFLWGKDSGDTSKQQWDLEDDPAAKRVWFANQLSDDACASQAILNVLFNRPDVELGEQLRSFRDETVEMSSVMKGLAISNHHFIRESQNSLARPADLRGALNAVATTTIEASKAKPPYKGPPPAKRRKTNAKSKAKTETKTAAADEETYHFIGYVPAYGKVWELDGLKAGPLEVGEVEGDSQGWMDVVRPALRLKMSKYAGEDNIRFNLLAIVDSVYEAVSDDLELLKRERRTLERRLQEAHGEGWAEKVDQSLLNSCPLEPDKESFASDFGARKQEKQVAVLELPERSLLGAWETCMREMIRAKVAVEEEFAKAKRENTEHVKRTHDYEPFVKEFITCLHEGGLLNPLLGLGEDGKKLPAPKSSKAKRKT